MHPQFNSSFGGRKQTKVYGSLNTHTFIFCQIHPKTCCSSWFYLTRSYTLVIRCKMCEGFLFPLCFIFHICLMIKTLKTHYITAAFTATLFQSTMMSYQEPPSQSLHKPSPLLSLATPVTWEDEMAGWHHWLNGHWLSKLWELVMDREAWHAACPAAAAKSPCPWGHKESDTTERLNWTEPPQVFIMHRDTRGMIYQKGLNQIKPLHA